MEFDIRRKIDLPRTARMVGVVLEAALHDVHRTTLDFGAILRNFLVEIL
jgi:exonuclease VII large subunit